MRNGWCQSPNARWAVSGRFLFSVCVW